VNSIKRKMLKVKLIMNFFQVLKGNRILSKILPSTNHQKLRPLNGRSSKYWVNFNSLVKNLIKDSLSLILFISRMTWHIYLQYNNKIFNSKMHSIKICTEWWVRHTNTISFNSSTIAILWTYRFSKVNQLWYHLLSKCPHFSSNH
jgi:hypothetical protein